MTTTVVISNLGGHADHVVVHVHIVPRNAQGRFERAANSQPRVLRAAECAELNVHDGVQLEIHEHSLRETGDPPVAGREGNADA